MSLQTQAARGLKWQAIEIAGRQLLSLVVFTTLARLLQPADFGLVGLVAVYLAFVAIFAEQGIGTAIIQRKELEPEHLDAAFWFNVGCAAMLCLATIALAAPLAHLAGEPQIAPLLRWASLALVINASAAIHGTLFIRDLDFRRPMIRTLLGNAVGGGVGVGMALGGYGVWALIGQQLGASAAGAVFLWAASPWRPRLSFSFRHLLQLMRMSGAVFATGLLWFVSSKADQFFIGRFLGAASLGFYVVGGKLADLARMAIHQPIGTVSLPALSRAQDDHARLRSAVYRGMTLNATAAIPALIGLAVIAPDAVPLLFGPQWLAAVPVLQLLAIYTLVNGLQVFFHPLLLATGGPGGYLVLNVVHALGVVVVCAIGVQHGVGPLIAGLILNGIAVGILAFGYLMRRVGLEMIPFWRPCLWPLAASGVMAIVVVLVRNHLPDLFPMWLGVSLQVVSGAIMYSVLMLLLSPGSLKQVLQFSGRAFRGVDGTDAAPAESLKAAADYAV